MDETYKRLLEQVLAKRQAESSALIPDEIKNLESSVQDMQSSNRNRMNQLDSIPRTESLPWDTVTLPSKYEGYRNAGQDNPMSSQGLKQDLLNQLDPGILDETDSKAKANRFRELFGKSGR